MSGKRPLVSYCNVYTLGYNIRMAKGKQHGRYTHGHRTGKPYRLGYVSQEMMDLIRARCRVLDISANEYTIRALAYYLVHEPDEEASS
jgi:hypothetical protein